MYAAPRACRLGSSSVRYCTAVCMSNLTKEQINKFNTGTQKNTLLHNFPAVMFGSTQRDSYSQAVCYLCAKLCLLNFFQIAQCAANQLALTTRCGMCEMWSLTLSCHTRNQSCHYGATSQSTALRKLTFHIAHSPCKLSDTWNLRDIGSSPSLRPSVTNTTNWVMRMTRERSGEPPPLKDCFQIDQYASELINSFHRHLNVFFSKVCVTSHSCQFSSC